MSQSEVRERTDRTLSEVYCDGSQLYSSFDSVQELTLAYIRSATRALNGENHQPNPLYQPLHLVRAEYTTFKDGNPLVVQFRFHTGDIECTHDDEPPIPEVLERLMEEAIADDRV